MFRLLQILITLAVISFFAFDKETLLTWVDKIYLFISIKITVIYDAMTQFPSDIQKCMAEETDASFMKCVGYTAEDHIKKLFGGGSA